MAKPSSLVLLAICLKTSDRSCMSSMVKLGECLLKYSLLASLTRLVSWLNASEQLYLSTLYQDGTSHHLELRGLSKVALDMLLPRGMSSMGSEEGCHLLGLGEHSGASEGGAAGANGCSAGEIPCDKVNGWVPAPSTSGRKLPMALWSLWGWLVRLLDRQRGSWSDTCPPPAWLVPSGVGWFWHVSIWESLTGRLPGPLCPRWLWNTGLWLPRWCRCRWPWHPGWHGHRWLWLPWWTTQSQTCSDEVPCPVPRLLSTCGYLWMI